jgi:hypothetical protein
LLLCCCAGQQSSIPGQDGRVERAAARLAVQAAAGALMQVTECKELVMWYTSVVSNFCILADLCVPPYNPLSTKGESRRRGGGGVRSRDWIAFHVYMQFETLPLVCLVQPHSSTAAKPGQISIEVSLLMLTPEEVKAGRREDSFASVLSTPAKGGEVRHRANEGRKGALQRQVSNVRPMDEDFMNLNSNSPRPLLPVM